MTHPVKSTSSDQKEAPRSTIGIRLFEGNWLPPKNAEGKIAYYARNLEIFGLAIRGLTANCLQLFCLLIRGLPWRGCI